MAVATGNEEDQWTFTLVPVVQVTAFVVYNGFSWVERHVDEVRRRDMLCLMHFWEGMRSSDRVLLMDDGTAPQTYQA
jgi:hypothetical protein